VLLVVHLDRLKASILASYSIQNRNTLATFTIKASRLKWLLGLLVLLTRQV
jgi:hypothetical protein